MRFFVDEDLDGDAFVAPVLHAGIDLVRHRNLFNKGVADIVWIPRVTTLELIVLSANTGMRLVPIEVAAIRQAGARILYLRQGKTSTHPELAKLFLRSQGRIQRFFAGGVRPRVGVLHRPSHAQDPDGIEPGTIVIPSAFR